MFKDGLIQRVPEVCTYFVLSGMMAPNPVLIVNCRRDVLSTQGLTVLIISETLTCSRYVRMASLLVGLISLDVIFCLVLEALDLCFGLTSTEK